MIGDPLSKVWTYYKVIEAAQIRSGTPADGFLTLRLDIVSLNVQRIAKRLVDSGGFYGRKYLHRNSTPTISGSSNPYTVDLSSLAPFLDKPERAVHVTSGGVRTPIKIDSPEEAEYQSGLSINSTSLFGSYEGDSLKLWKGSSFTITTGTDTIDLLYYREAKVGTTSSASVVSDTSWSASGTTISGFTGMTTALVGGIFVGLDNGENAFARTITQYVSATSFIVSSALVAGGAGMNGYIIPPNSNTYTVTTGTYVDIPDPFGELLITLVAADFSRYKNGIPDQILEQSGLSQLDNIYRSAAVERVSGDKKEE